MISKVIDYTYTAIFLLVVGFAVGCYVVGSFIWSQVVEGVDEILDDMDYC